MLPIDVQQLSPWSLLPRAHEGADGSDVASARSDGLLLPLDGHVAKRAVLRLFVVPCLELGLGDSFERLYIKLGCTQQLSRPMGARSSQPFHNRNKLDFSSDTEEYY